MKNKIVFLSVLFCLYCMQVFASVSPSNPTICMGATVTLTDASHPGGTWSGGNSYASVDPGSGLVTGMETGTAAIVYTYGSGTTETTTVNVISSTVPDPINGTFSLCPNQATNLTDATAGGTWSSSNGLVGTIGTTSGVFTADNGTYAGTTTITYTQGGCKATQMITVNHFPQDVQVTANHICENASMIVTDDSVGGTWSGSGDLTVSGTGTSGTMVAGAVTGTGSITYTLPTGCFKVFTTMNVEPNPSAILGTFQVCAGSVTILSDATTNGLGWASSNTFIATTTAGGAVTGVASGTSIITFTAIMNGVVQCSTTQEITVNPVPVITSSTGENKVCAGSAITLNSTITGGTWSCTNSTGSATIGASSGVLTGVGGASGGAKGTVTATYTLPTGCYTTLSITVYPVPGAITGPGSFCLGATITLSDSPNGGQWSSSNTPIATVVSAGSNSGAIGTTTVTAVAGGTATITYQVAIGCYSTRVESVNPLPINITDNPGGPFQVCVGSQIVFDDGTYGGSWTSSNTAKGSIVGATGTETVTVVGISSGTTVISYSSGSCVTTATLTVNPLPTITSSGGVCGGQTITLAATPTGGTWSGSNSNASIDPSSGVVTASSSLTTVGTVTITYTTTAGCIATTNVTVYPFPSGITLVSGTNPTCAASAIEGISTVTLADGITGGTWSILTGTLMPIGPVTGVITLAGLTAGYSTTAVEGYQYTTSAAAGCTVTYMLTVNPNPEGIAASTFGGDLFFCAPVGIETMVAAPTGGIWSSSNASVASIDPSSGFVSAVSAGTTTFTYTVNPGNCWDTITIKISPPLDPTILLSGSLNECVGGTEAQLYNPDTSPGWPGGPYGYWWSSNTSVATVSNAGYGWVDAISAGTVTITYSYYADFTSATNSGCYALTTITVGVQPITGSATVCQGSVTTLADATAGGTWSSSNTAVATIDASGNVTGISAGTTIITYTLPTGCLTTTTVTVNPLPSAITGTMAVCVGPVTTLADAGGGTWSSSNTSVATVDGSGNITGIASGTVTITYTLPTGCLATTTITVNPSPSAITGTMAVCAGSVTTLADAGSGIWSSSNTSVATVDGGGNVTGIASGTVTITYTLPTGCLATTTVTVNPLPSAITGTMAVCVGSVTTLADAGSGIWSSSNTSVATVDGGGNVTGIASGTVTITYTLPTGCIATTAITVNPLPSAITGTTSVCEGAVTTLAGAGGGTWSSSNTSVATVDGSGNVTGIVAGTVTVTYALPTGCIATTTVTVDPLPIVSPITGNDYSICPDGHTSGGIYYLALSSGGSYYTTSSWSFSSAIVGYASYPFSTSTTAYIIGNSGGTATISFTVTNGCGSATATTVATINPAPDPGIISGASSVCVGGTTLWAETVSGGSWGSGHDFVYVSSDGLVTGVSAGSDYIGYGVANSFGCVSSTIKDITVNAAPAAISGTFIVCQGQTTTFTDAGGGAWSSSNTSVASVDASTGIVSGITPGTATITYTLGTGCTTTQGVTINAGPAAISGTATECVGATTTLADATTGGTWSSSNTSVATVDASTGIVSGITPGTATITYTLGTGCTTTQGVTINAGPAAISGTFTECVGATTTLADATTGGTWSSSYTSVATVDASTGIVSGITPGTATITYTLGTGCFATGSVTVNPVPLPITGDMSLCQFAFELYDATPGGTWSSSNISVLVVLDPSIGNIINASFGILGTATITYTLSGGCYTTAAVTVNPSGAITGAMPVCQGSSETLYDAVAGGDWSSSNTDIATVDASGVVSGVSSGTAQISYIVGGACPAIITVTVNPVPSPINGTLSVCQGATTTLSDDTPGGTWSNDTHGYGSVDGTGVVTGEYGGTVTISYIISSGCFAAAAVIVNPLPLAWIYPFSTYPNPICIYTGDLYVPPSGWYGASLYGDTYNFSISDPTVGAMTSYTDVVLINGLSAGTVTVSYTVSNSCGSDVATAVVTVNPSPDAGTISGASSICVGATTIFTDDVSGGTWSSGDESIVTIDPVTGLVTGISVSGAAIYYTVINSFGCADRHIGAIMVTSCDDGGRQSAPDNTSNIAEAGGDWVCFPNPNKGTFTLAGSLSNTTTSKEAKIEVVDMLGKVIYHDVAPITDGGINKAITLGDNITNGVYLIRVINDNSSKVIRFTLER